MTAGPETSEIQPTTEPAAPEEGNIAPVNPVREFLNRAGLVEKLAALKILNEQFQSDNPQFQELFPTIEADPELLKRFLKFANGGWFNSRIQVDSPYMAYTRYGTEGFYKLALATFLAHGIGEIGTRCKIWPHLESVARTGESVATQLAPKLVEDIFTAGLLHDAVVPAMEKELPDYLYFLECAMNTDPVVTRLENSCHAFDHAQAAGELASALSFQNHIVEAVTQHHHVSVTSVSEGKPRAVLALLLITKRVQNLRPTQRRIAFETPAEKKLLEEISSALGVSPGRVQLAVTDILEDLRLRDG